MTKRQFIIASLLKKIGIQRKQKRLLAAADELHLLKQAGIVLGRNVWQNLENIEYYKVNYWSIDKIQQEINVYDQKIKDIEEEIQNIKKQQKINYNQVEKSDPIVEQQYKEQKTLVDEITTEIKAISNEATYIKRSFDGAMAKLKAMTENDNINQEQENIEQLKTKFLELKNRKHEADQNLAKESATLKQLSTQLSKSKKTYKDISADNHDVMAKANQSLNTYKSKIGHLENEASNHYFEIGENISVDCFIDNDCRIAVKQQFKLCKIIRALKKSIDYNSILADR